MERVRWRCDTKRKRGPDVWQEAMKNNRLFSNKSLASAQRHQGQHVGTVKIASFPESHVVSIARLDNALLVID